MKASQHSKHIYFRIRQQDMAAVVMVATRADTVAAMAAVMVVVTQVAMEVRNFFLMQSNLHSNWPNYEITLCGRYVFCYSISISTVILVYI